MPPTKTTLRLSLIAALLAWIGDASALGLGELRTRSFLGEPLVAEVGVLVGSGEKISAGCFHLRAPLGDAELPWLKRATLNLRKGPQAVLEIRGDEPLREPVLQVGITIGCGYEVLRDYTLFFSPRGMEGETPVPETAPRPVAPPAAAPRRQAPALAGSGEAPPRLVPRPPERRAKPAVSRDRLMLSGGGEFGGEAPLKLTTELGSWQEWESSALAAQRDMLRLEYRMLAMLNEQATSQLAAAERLRHMEGLLGELQRHAGDVGDRLEKGVVGSEPPVQAPAQPEPAPAAQPAAVPTAAPAEPVPAMPLGKTGTAAARPGLLSEWSFYGALLGAVLGVGGWVGWRQYRLRREAAAMSTPSDFVSEPVADPRHAEEAEPIVDIGLEIEPSASVPAVHVDVPLDAEEAPAPAIPAPPGGPDSLFSVSGATVDEQFEVNPVMELAEIMLSFGRVKGAAQALQEYIDQNPEEALQPWIRLMEVYRMAGMREEFERLALDLNRHFNVEVQQWDKAPAKAAEREPLDFILDFDALEIDSAQPEAAKATSLEDFQHICGSLAETWGTPQCKDYLERLLRDNRGGKRSGFALPVIEEILFLIELSETKTMLEKQGMNGETSQ